MSLEELFKGRGVNIPSVLAHLKKVAGECGLPFGDRSQTFNSRRAQELGKWAESLGRGEEFHQAVFRAYFADGLNIGKVPILVKLIESFGLDGGEAEQVLLNGFYSAAVDRDWTYSRTCGITAVPTFIANGKKAVGAQPYEVLVKLVNETEAKATKIL
jgi:predicted DsbA family dithiol-disulfide isomerase